jgi:hypothetical protein
MSSVGTVPGETIAVGEVNVVDAITTLIDVRSSIAIILESVTFRQDEEDILWYYVNYNT